MIKNIFLLCLIICSVARVEAIELSTENSRVAIVIQRYWLNDEVEKTALLASLRVAEAYSLIIPKVYPNKNNLKINIDGNTQQLTLVSSDLQDGVTISYSDFIKLLTVKRLQHSNTARELVGWQLNPGS